MKLLKLILLIILIQTSNLYSTEFKWMKRGATIDPGNIEVSPDGKYCALGGGGNDYIDIQVYDIDSAHVKLTYFYDDYDYGVYLHNKVHFDFTNDSKNFIFPAMSKSDSVQICRIVNIETKETIKEHSISKDDLQQDLQIHSIFTLHSDKILIILSSYSKCKFVIWDYISGQIKESQIISIPDMKIIDFSKESNTIVILNNDNEITTYSANDFSQLLKWKIQTNEGDYIQIMDVSDYGNQIAVTYVNSGGDAGIKIYDSQTGKLISTLKEGFLDLIFTFGMCFTKDGKNLIYPRGSEYKNIELENTKKFSIYPLNGGEKLRIVDENRIISYSVFYGIANVIDLYSGNLHKRINPFLNPIDYVDFSYDDKYITLFMENSFGLLDTETGDVIRFKYMDFERRNWFESSPDSYEIAYPAYDNSIVIYNYETDNVIKRLTGHNGIINSIIYSKDGKQLISTSEDKTVKIWDLSTGDIIFDYDSKENLRFAGFTTNSNLILVFFYQNNLPGMFLFDIHSKEIVKKLNVGEIPKVNIAYLSTNQSDNYKYFSYSGKKTGIWNIDDLSLKNYLNSSVCESNIMSLAFNKNNSFISGYCYNKIMVWGLDGNLIKAYDDLPKMVNGNDMVLTKSLAVSNNSKYILTSNDLRYLTLWNAPSVTSVDDNETNSTSDDLFVYPNPASENVNIQLPEFSSVISYQIYNSIGELIIEEKNTATSEKLSIPSINLLSGYYFCRIILNNQVINKSFLIQK